MLEEYKFYEDGVQELGNGVKDYSPDGLGMLGPVPALAAGWQNWGIPPSQIQSAPADYCSARIGGTDYVWMFYKNNDTVYRYSSNANGLWTADGSTTILAMGFAATSWNELKCAWVDPVEGSIIIHAITANTGTGRTPVLGKWLLSAWPWTSANALWLSPVAHTYGSVAIGELCNYATGMWNTVTKKFYLASINTGQVCTINSDTGALLGFYHPFTGYSAAYCFNLYGFNADDQPVAGGYLSQIGNKHTWVYDDTTPTSWSQVAKILDGAGAAALIGQTSWGRAAGANYGGRNRTLPLSPDERAMIGITDRCTVWTSNRYISYGESIFMTLVPVVGGEHQHRVLTQSSERRGAPNIEHANGESPRFVEIDGYPWLLGFTRTTLDHEDEAPGNSIDRQMGLTMMPVGPVSSALTMTATSDGTPKKILIQLGKDAVNYMNSESHQKHEFRLLVNGHPMSWRSGVRELTYLDEVVNGKLAWIPFSRGDILRLEWRMCCGFPYTWDNDVRGNPGEVGDPDTPPIGEAQVGPPMRIKPTLQFTPGEQVPTSVSQVRVIATES